MSVRARIVGALRRVPGVRTVVWDWGWGIRVPLSVVVTNYFFQLVLRQNARVKYPVAFTSKVVCPERLVFTGRRTAQLSSLALSGGCYLQAGNGIEIGEGTIWAPNVAIVSANHNPAGSDRSWLQGDPIRIGKNCWIGANAVILAGVELGDETVVGAGAVVTKSFPSGGCVLVGVPARPLRREDDIL